MSKKCSVLSEHPPGHLKATVCLQQGHCQCDPVNASWLCVLEIFFYTHSNIVGVFFPEWK